MYGFNKSIDILVSYVVDMLKYVVDFPMITFPSISISYKYNRKRTFSSK